MSTTNATISVFPSLLPNDIRALFGDPPLLRGEEASLYNNLMDQFSGLVGPKDMIEWWWVKDMTDHSWEIRRLRRFKVLLIELDRDREHSDRQFSAANAAFVKTEFVEGEGGEESGYVETYRPYDPPPVPDSEKDSVGFFKHHIRDYKSIDSLIASAELRRDRTLREIERRRENLARRLRKVSDQIVEDKLEDKITELRRAA